jgi:hypothetical protein
VVYDRKAIISKIETNQSKIAKILEDLKVLA